VRTLTPVTTSLATRLDEDLWLLDTCFQRIHGVIASYLLVGPGGLALVDVGAAATVEQLFGAVHAAGQDPEAIAHIVLTHIHLDHAGASGTIVRRLPRARVYVHRRGAAHLVDPSRLLSSAQRIYGERMRELWGDIEPVPADRLVVIDEGAEVHVGGRALRALYTPGHAVHHVAYHDPQRSTLFAGDVAGVRLAGVDFVRPPTPPPDLSLEDWFASLDRLAGLGLAQLYLAHFGPCQNVDAHVAELRARLADWGRLMLAGMRAGQDDDTLTAALARAGDELIVRAVGDPRAREDVLARYEIATNYRMSAQGYVRYYRKQHPELLA
jgi:glyoxylase-like metal-dependent hydrolase (beta-lactamase superfamily II)